MLGSFLFLSNIVSNKLKSVLLILSDAPWNLYEELLFKVLLCLRPFTFRDAYLKASKWSDILRTRLGQVWKHMLFPLVHFSPLRFLQLWNGSCCVHKYDDFVPQKIIVSVIYYTNTIKYYQCKKAELSIESQSAFDTHPYKKITQVTGLSVRSSICPLIISTISKRCVFLQISPAFLENFSISRAFLSNSAHKCINKDSFQSFVSV